MRRVRWLLAGTIAVVVGCASNAPPASAPERPTLKATPRPGIAYVAVIGDEHTSGSRYGGTGSRGWPALARDLLQKQGLLIDPAVGAKDGSGYGKHATVGSERFIDQVERVAGANDRLVILFGSNNDKTTPSDNLTTSLRRTFAKVKKKAPDARLLAIGPAEVQPPSPSADVFRARDITREQAEAAGGTFIDPLEEGWFDERWDLFGGNGKYPNDAGHVVMADRIAALIAQLIQPPNEQ